MIRKFVSSAVMASEEGLTDRQIRVRASTGAVDRAGDVLMPKGCILRTKTVPVLLDHDATIGNIVGNAVITVTDSSVDALVTFLPEGVAANADDACTKYKLGMADACSVGFDPIDFDKTKTGIIFKQWELLELSLVVVGCNQEALVTEKALPVVMAKDAAPAKTKGLYACSQLANLLGELAWLEEMVEWEAEYEGDGSPLPQMLADIMRAMGDALIAMTAEEVAELLGEEKSEPAEKAFRAAVAKSLNPARKAGRVISAANADHLAAAHGHMDEAMKCVKTVLDSGDDAEQAEEPEAITSDKAIPTIDHYRRKAAAIAAKR